jgi:hypothetical protein
MLPMSPHFTCKYHHALCVSKFQLLISPCFLCLHISAFDITMLLCLHPSPVNTTMLSKSLHFTCQHHHVLCVSTFQLLISRCPICLHTAPVNITMLSMYPHFTCQYHHVLCVSTFQLLVSSGCHRTSAFDITMHSASEFQILNKFAYFWWNLLWKVWDRITPRRLAFQFPLVSNHNMAVVRICKAVVTPISRVLGS